MSVIIRPIRLEDAPAFRDTLQAVADERRYILTLTAPPLDSVCKFVANTIDKGYPQLVADKDDAIIGWADFIPVEKESLMHCASLGMAVRKPWRGKGIGERLLEAVTQAAIDYGFTRLELEVFSNNTAAIGLYEKHHFQLEGRRAKARYIDNEYFDILMMARLIDRGE